MGRVRAPGGARVLAAGVWRHQRWAAAALLLLGAVIAATALVEAFVGIVGWLYALLIAIAAIVIAILLGAYVNRSGPLLQRERGSPPA